MYQTDKLKKTEAQSDKPYLVFSHAQSYLMSLKGLNASSSRCLRDPRSVCVKEQIIVRQ